MAYDSDTLLNTRLGKINAIYRGTIAIITSNTTNTATITAVVLARSVITHLGWAHPVSDTAGTSIYHPGTYLSLTNTTTVTATRGGDTANTTTTSYQVVEYAA